MSRQLWGECACGYGAFVLRTVLKNKNSFHVPQPTVSTTVHKTGFPKWLEPTLLFLSGGILSRLRIPSQRGAPSQVTLRSTLAK